MERILAIDSRVVRRPTVPARYGAALEAPSSDSPLLQTTAAAVVSLLTSGYRHADRSASRATRPRTTCDEREPEDTGPRPAYRPRPTEGGDVRFLPTASRRLAHWRAMLPDIIRAERQTLMRRRLYWEVAMQPNRRLHLPK